MGFFVIPCLPSGARWIAFGEERDVVFKRKRSPVCLIFGNPRPWRLHIFSQLAKVYEEDLATTTVSAGANGTQISFPEWETGSFADDGLSASRTFSVAAFTGNEAG